MIAAQPSIAPRALASLPGIRRWASSLLSARERRALENAVPPAKSVAANTDLLREGDRTDTLFVVIDGWACRYATTREGGRHLHALLLPGDLANLPSLMFDQLDFGVRTITPVSVATLPRDRALALAAEHPGIARAFTWQGLLENGILSRWSLALGRRSAVERLAHLLCELSVRLGVGDGEASRFPFPLTQEQLADTLGLTPVHVNRTMQTLRGDGLIATANRILTLPDLPRLRHVGGFDPRYLHAALTAPCRAVVD